MNRNLILSGSIKHFNDTVEEINVQLKKFDYDAERSKWTRNHYAFNEVKKLLKYEISSMQQYTRNDQFGNSWNIWTAKEHFWEIKVVRRKNFSWQQRVFMVYIICIFYGKFKRFINKSNICKCCWTREAKILLGDYIYIMILAYLIGLDPTSTANKIF